MRTVENSILTSAFGPLKWYEDPTPEEIEKAFRHGTWYWGNFQALRVVKDGDRVLQHVKLTIMQGNVKSLDIPGSNLNELNCCFIRKFSRGEKGYRGGLLVWSPEIEVNTEKIVEDTAGAEFPLWDCNRVPLSVGIDLVKRLFSEGYEGDDFLWAGEDECRALEFDDLKKLG